jgi:hypothetical protein
VHWKTVPLTRWAAGRPFVWLDDETTDADRWWVAAHHWQPALLHRVDPFLVEQQLSRCTNRTDNGRRRGVRASLPRVLKGRASICAELAAEIGTGDEFRYASIARDWSHKLADSSGTSL